MIIEGMRHAQVVNLHRFDGNTSRTLTTWSYRVRDPYAVTVTFPTGEGAEVQWCFARELLIHGRTRPSGTGDIRVRPHPDEVSQVQVGLWTSTGHSIFDVDGRWLRRWVNVTIGLVPLGAESDFVDFATLDDLLTCD